MFSAHTIKVQEGLGNGALATGAAPAFPFQRDRSSSGGATHRGRVSSGGAVRVAPVVACAGNRGVSVSVVVSVVVILAVVDTLYDNPVYPFFLLDVLVVMVLVDVVVSVAGGVWSSWRAPYPALCALDLAHGHGVACGLEHRVCGASTPPVPSGALSAR